MKIKAKLRHIFVLLYLVIGRSHARKMPGLTRVVVFHHLDKVNVFEKIVRLFQRQYHILSFEDFLCGKKSSRKLNIIFSFDDGYKSWFSNGLSIFERYDIKPIFFLNSDFIDCDEPEAKSYCKRHIHTWSEDSLSWQQVSKLSAIGGELGGHTIRHTDLTSDTLDDKRKFSSILIDKNRIENNSLKKIKVFSYPFGRWTESASKIVSDAGFEYAFTSDSGFLEESPHNLALSRTNVGLRHPIIARAYAEGCSERLTEDLRWIKRCIYVFKKS